jgi:Protein of unknown function (DUF2934)
MANKLSPTYGAGAHEGATDGLSPPALPRGERTDKRSAATKPRPLAEIVQPSPPNRAPANFDPSSSREALIATAAYYRAEKRGFRRGHETEDWLAAEREVDGTGTAPTI